MYPKVETLFAVNGVTRPFEGSGQKAARAARRSVPGKNNLILKGFTVDGKYIPADLNTSQYNTRNSLA